MTKKYELTYDGSDVPTQYGFFSRSQLDAIKKGLEDAKRQLARSPGPRRTGERREPVAAAGASAAEVRAVIAALDPRGAWVERGMIRVDGRQREEQPIIESRTFIRNLALLALYSANAR
jgi:hypothetical protein